MHRRIWAVIVLAGLVGCSSGEHMATAEQGVTEFRQFMESRQFARVYAASSVEFRKTTSEAEMVRILGALNNKLGSVKNAEKNGWNVNFHTSGTFVTLGFKTEFEKGSGAERFVFRIADGRAALVSYNVNSPALLTN
jgi:hypothetical protein